MVLFVPILVALIAIVAVLAWRALRSVSFGGKALLAREGDETDPPMLPLCCVAVKYALLVMRGYFLEYAYTTWATVTRPLRSSASAPPWRAGPPLFSGWQCVYIGHVFGRISDCWNRPIAGPVKMQ